MRQCILRRCRIYCHVICNCKRIWFVGFVGLTNHLWLQFTNHYNPFPFLSVPELSPAPATSSSLSTGCLQKLSQHDSKWQSVLVIYSPGADRTENTSSNIYSAVAHESVAVITWRALSHCLTTGAFAVSLPINRCLFWFHNSALSKHAKYILK
jgi:hypothetical protein